MDAGSTMRRENVGCAAPQSTAAFLFSRSPISKNTRNANAPSRRDWKPGKCQPRYRRGRIAGPDDKDDLVASRRGVHACTNRVDDDISGVSGDEHSRYLIGQATRRSPDDDFRNVRVRLVRFDVDRAEGAPEKANEM
jgi:hypothetical protein